MYWLTVLGTLASPVPDGMVESRLLLERPSALPVLYPLTEWERRTSSSARMEGVLGARLGLLSEKRGWSMRAD